MTAEPITQSNNPATDTDANHGDAVEPANDTAPPNLKETLTDETRTDTAPESSAAPVRLPDNHPLLKTLATLRAENAKLAKQLAQTTNGHQQELADIKTHLAAANAAITHGLNKADADLIRQTAANSDDPEYAEKLARRLAQTKPATTAPSLLPVISELGQTATTEQTDEAKFAAAMEKAFTQNRGAHFTDIDI